MSNVAATRTTGLRRSGWIALCRVAGGNLSHQSPRTSHRTERFSRDTDRELRTRRKPRWRTK
eukprot:1802342-Prymnesium_polylepis.1